MPSCPISKLNHVCSSNNLRCLAGADVPSSNAQNLGGEQYLVQVLEEAETERKFSEGWQAAIDTGYERRHVVAWRKE